MNVSSDRHVGSRVLLFVRLRSWPLQTCLSVSVQTRNQSQEEFAARYHIPIGTLRDWEQGRTDPDQPARAYLKVIARDPEHVHRI